MSIIKILLDLFILSISGVCFYFCVSSALNGFSNIKNVIVFVLTLIFAIVFFVFWVYLITRKIELKDCGVHVAADFSDGGFFFRRVQHNFNVEYTEIKDIFIVTSNSDSRNKKVDGLFISLPYLIFECYDGRIEAINVYYYGRKQVAKLIDMVKMRAVAQGNDLQIESGEILVRKFIAKEKRKRKRN